MRQAAFTTQSGRQLYMLLPAVYRDRDNTNYENGRITALGDLALYLDSIGTLLDRLRATLDQRLADAFPDRPPDGRACQEWLIPYFARLLDVNLVSPHVAGQRDEVANAIAWRQRKGTLACVESISESITREEVELQEGWRRVAMTPRIGEALLPLAVFGVTKRLNPNDPASMARHPGLPTATVDFRCPSQALQTGLVSPAVHNSRFRDVPRSWMQANPAGVPVALDSFDDVSRRTVDLRTPTASTGHYHPRRLLAYMPPPYGLFTPADARVNEELLGSPLVAWTYDPDNRHLHIRRRALESVVVTYDPGAEIGIDFERGPVDVVTLEGLDFPGTLTVAHARLNLRDTRVGELIVNHAFFFEDQPGLDARDCLIGILLVPGAYARLDSCTVLRTTNCDALLAGNSIFVGLVQGPTAGTQPRAGFIHHSRLPSSLLPTDATHSQDLIVDTASCTTDAPQFLATDYGAATSNVLSADAGVLHPANPASLCFGAEDGGEMGAYHRGRLGRPVRVAKNQNLDSMQEHGYVLRDLVFAGRIDVSERTQPPLHMQRVAAGNAVFASASATADIHTALDARECLFGSLTVTNGAARLEYCTVLGDTLCALLQASDCIFSGDLRLSNATTRPHCARYSRVPDRLLQARATTPFPSCTAAPPLFLEASFDRGSHGVAGCGVLHASAPTAISRGAEDGGEMGAYHEQRYCLGRTAALDKLAEHLPVSLEPILFYDLRLLLDPAIARPPVST